MLEVGKRQLIKRDLAFRKQFGLEVLIRIDAFRLWC